MTSVSGGTVGRFVAQSDFAWASEFAGLVPGTPAFTQKWKEVAVREPEKFQDAQHAYIKRTHFDPLAATIRADDGLDITTRSHALQNAVWSTAVQHGPNTPVIHRALAQMKASSGVSADQPDFDKTLIVAIYAERGRRDAQGSLVYFSTNSAAVQDGVAKRFVAEQRDALQMLANES
jgi:type VI secretion system (T6SS) spike protein VgrG3